MPLLEARGVNVSYRPSKGGHVWAVRDVDLDVEEGEFVGVVGESGCGKSTLGFALTRNLAPPAVLDSGVIKLSGVDLASLGSEELRLQRRKGIAVVLQSGMNALNPVRTIAHQLGDTLKAHQEPGEKWDSRSVHDFGVELCELVELEPRVLDMHPHELSGGMRQRVAIALVLSLEPRLVVFDEPTTALDVIVQAALMKTIQNLQRARGFSAILISHDLSVVLEATDRTIVMYAGRIVDDLPSKLVIAQGHHHPYTDALLKCYGDPRADDLVLQDIPGSPPDLSADLIGCAFEPRCTEAQEVCSRELPQLVHVGSECVACHMRIASSRPLVETE